MGIRWKNETDNLLIKIALSNSRLTVTTHRHRRKINVKLEKMFELMRQINQTLIGTSWVRLPLAAKYLAIISLSIVIIKFMKGSKKIEEILLEWWTERSPRIPAA